MKIEKQYIIEKWTDWDDCLYNAIEDFKKSFQLMPTILAANKHTHSQIDFLANVVPEMRECVVNIDSVTGQVTHCTPDEEFKLLDYHCDFGEISFCYDYELPDKVFCLIYDDEADFEDSQIIQTPINEKEVVVI